MSIARKSKPVYISRLFCEELYPGCFFFVYSLFSLTGTIVFSLHDDRMSGAYMLIAAVLSISPYC